MKIIKTQLVDGVYIPVAVEEVQDTTKQRVRKALQRVAQQPQQHVQVAQFFEGALQGMDAIDKFMMNFNPYGKSPWHDPYSR